MFLQSTAERRAVLPCCILITGATGFLGGAIVVDLLNRGYASSLRFLVRAATPLAGLARLQDNLSRFSVGDDLLRAIHPAQILSGEIGNLATLRDDPRLADVTHVINCAALATFSNSPKIWPVNVTGTFELARILADRAPLARFVQVGTAMCCGPGKPVPVTEAWEAEIEKNMDLHLVPYTASKLAIELKLRAELPTLPLIVARPSIIVGHTVLGCKPSASIFWVFRMAHALEQFTCELDERIDVVPVDFCANAIVELTLKEELRYDLYHVSAGTTADRFRDIDVAFARAAGVSPVGERYRKIEVDQLVSLVPLFKARLGSVHRSLIVRALKLYGAFAELNYVFDNARLLGEGIAAPPPLTQYIDRCVATSAGIPIQEQMAYDFK